MVAIFVGDLVLLRNGRLLKRDFTVAISFPSSFVHFKMWSQNGDLPPPGVLGVFVLDKRQQLSSSEMTKPEGLTMVLIVFSVLDFACVSSIVGAVDLNLPHSVN